eukprot:UN05987
MSRSVTQFRSSNAALSMRGLQRLSMSSSATLSTSKSVRLSTSSSATLSMSRSVMRFVMLPSHLMEAPALALETLVDLDVVVALLVAEEAQEPLMVTVLPLLHD